SRTFPFNCEFCISKRFGLVCAHAIPNAVPGQLMRLVYNILFPVFFLLSAPFYFLKMWRRGNVQTGFGQRFGFYDASLRTTNDKPCIWFHAVSVGEVGICAQLLRELGPNLPGYDFLVSTTTSTGMGELK